MKRAEKREKLIEVASQMFNEAGYHATGIDQIIEAAGVAKTTLYRHFASKEDLIVAVLRRTDRQYRDELHRTVVASPLTGKQKLLATFDFLEQWFRQKDFFGCPFVSAAAEYSDRGSPVFHEALMHKRLVVDYFEELGRKANVANAAELAHRINLLHEGAVAVAHVSADPEVAAHARAMAKTLLESA